MSFYPRSSFNFIFILGLLTVIAAPTQASNLWLLDAQTSPASQGKLAHQNLEKWVNTNPP